MRKTERVTKKVTLLQSKEQDRQTDKYVDRPQGKQAWKQKKYLVGGQKAGRQAEGHKNRETDPYESKKGRQISDK